MSLICKNSRFYELTISHIPWGSISTQDRLVQVYVSIHKAMTFNISFVNIYATSLSVDSLNATYKFWGSPTLCLYISLILVSKYLKAKKLLYYYCLYTKQVSYMYMFQLTPSVVKGLWLCINFRNNVLCHYTRQYQCFMYCNSWLSTVMNVLLINIVCRNFVW